MTENTSSITPIEAINEFYRLKNKYESEYHEKYVKPIIKSQKSKREKRVEYSKLPKHECINCKRNVGTLFQIKFDDTNHLRKFTAKCGDIQNPCPLDILIEYNYREKLKQYIKEELTLIEAIKLNIIKEKNNTLFFNKNVVDIFNQLTQELKLETETAGVGIETNILRNDSPEKALLLKQTIDEFGKGFILPFKQLVKDFDDTNNELIMNQAMKFYIEEIMPKLKEILSLKYDVSMVEFDDTNNNYRLIQMKNSLESNEFYYKQFDKVVKFVRGVKKEKNKTRKDNSEFKSKSKTKKIKPTFELVLEDDEEEIIESKEKMDESQEKMDESQEQMDESQEQMDESQEQMDESQEKSINWGTSE